MTLYGVLLIVGLYFVFWDQTTYACNLPEQNCPLCGMKSAVYHLLHLRFIKAHEYNPYVWLVVILGALMGIDASLIIYRYIRKRK
jgi:hypothetical protein